MRYPFDQRVFDNCDKLMLIVKPYNESRCIYDYTTTQIGRAVETNPHDEKWLTVSRRS